MAITDIRPTTTSSGLNSNSNQFDLTQFHNQPQSNSNHTSVTRFQANSASHHKTHSSVGNFKFQQIRPKLKTNFSEPDIKADLNYGNIDQGPFFEQLSVNTTAIRDNETVALCGTKIDYL